MSGHSKWANIKHRKAAQDAKKSKIFTKLIKELTVAAREGGGDPNSNPRLRTVMDKAREANMTKDVVERAIKRGTGELEGVDYVESTFEGYGPAGTAFYVLTLTDNKNRTTAEIRHIFSANGGNLAESGSVAWQFERKGALTIPKDKISDMDELELDAIDAGAEDFESDDEGFTIYTSPEDLQSVREALSKKYEVSSGEITYISKNLAHVTGADARKVLKLMDALEDHDDVQDVYSNFDIDDEELEQIENEG